MAPLVLFEPSTTVWSIYERSPPAPCPVGCFTASRVLPALLSYQLSTVYSGEEKLSLNRQTTAGQPLSISQRSLPLLHHQRHHQPTVSRSVLGLQARRPPPPPTARGNSTSRYGLSCAGFLLFLNPLTGLWRTSVCFSSSSRKRCKTSPIRAAS